MRHFKDFFMNVTELIELTNQLSTDESELSPRQREHYLKHLNLANMELYTIAAGGLKTITQKVDIFLDAATESFLIPTDLYLIRMVFINKLRLTPCDVDFEPSIPVDRYLAMGNSIYCNLVSTISGFPSKIDPNDGTVKRYITLFYAPLPKKLVETVNDPLTETDTPVYPEPYHQFLAFGSLYYFYFANKVFMEKMAYIRNVWESSKTELGKYKNYGL